MFKLKSIEEEVDFLNLCIYDQTQKYRGRNKRNLYCLVKLQVNTNRAGGRGSGKGLQKFLGTTIRLA